MKVADAGITVTTATRSEAEVRTDLGQSGTEKPAETTAPAAAAAATPTSTATPEDEANSARPDADVSDAARALRANRLSERKKRLNDDNALYEDTIARLGGKVSPFAPKGEYKKPQDELDELSRRRNELLRETNRLLRERPAGERREPAAPPPAAAPAPAAAAAPTPFEFPEFEEWEQKNSGKSFTAYMNARDDARDQWKTERDRTASQAQRDSERQAEQQRDYADGVQKFSAAQDTFKAEHADYDAVLMATRYPAGTPPRLLDTVERLVLRSAADGPKILYFLGKNPDDAARLFNAPNMGVLLETFGEVKYAALKASGMSTAAATAAVASTATAAPVATPAPAPAAAAAAPSQPVSSAPAPVTQVPGGAHSTRSLQSIADDSDDADSYIAERRAQQKRGG